MSDDGPDERLLSDIHTIDPTRSEADLQKALAESEARLQALTPDSDPVERAAILLDMAEAHLGLNQVDAAWGCAREAFDAFIERERWTEAVEACDILYKTDKDRSLAALGQGVWLAVTYPVPPALTMTMLHHIVDETPDKSDGGAVAAAAADYVVHLRAEGKERENLGFFTSQVLAQVAKRHRNIEDEESIRIWMDMLGLDDPKHLLPALAKVVDTIVGDEWWFDRDALREKLPVN